MAIGADDDEVCGATLCMSKDDVGDRLPARLHRLDDDSGSVTRQVMSHIGARLFAVARVLLRIDHEEGNGLGADEKRKRIRYRTPRLATGIPGDDDMLGRGPGPALRQDEERHSGSEKQLFGRPVAGQSTGPRAPDDHQIGMQGIQPGAVIDCILMEKTKLEADAFSRTACRKTPPCVVYRGGID